jgi:hypothetical protein
MWGYVLLKNIKNNSLFNKNWSEETNTNIALKTDAWFILIYWTKSMGLFATNGKNYGCFYHTKAV